MLEYMLRIREGLHGKPRTSVMIKQSVLADIPNDEAQRMINNVIRNAFEKAKVDDSVVLLKTTEPGEWTPVLDLVYGTGSLVDMMDSVYDIVCDAVLVKETKTTTDECSICKYSVMTDKTKGICRRYPPVFKPMRKVSIDEFVSSHEKTGIDWIDNVVQTNSEYPEVVATGWCGEFKE